MTLSFNWVNPPRWICAICGMAASLGMRQVAPKRHARGGAPGPRRLLLLAAGSATALLLAGCSSGSGTPAAAAPLVSGAVLEQPYSLPTETFINTEGVSTTLKVPAKGDLTLVFYGFTHCGDDCPTTMADIEAALRGMPAAEQSRITMDFMTTDPWRDTGPVMRAWLNQYNTAFQGYTAANWSILHASAVSLGVDMEKPASFAGDYQVTHGLQVLGFTSDGKAHIEWLVENIQVDQLRSDFELILKGTPIQ
jgi:protein SCO1/2